MTGTELVTGIERSACKSMFIWKGFEATFGKFIREDGAVCFGWFSPIDGSFYGDYVCSKVHDPEKAKDLLEIQFIKVLQRLKKL